MQEGLATDGQGSRDDVLVIRLAGDLSHDRAAGLMREIDGAVHEGRTRIALGLSAVTFLSDTCLGAFVKSCKIAREAGGDVRLFGLHAPFAAS